MIGIICAEPEELNEIIKLMTSIKKEKLRCMEFSIGKILDTECVVSLSGVGKVHAAMCAQTLIIKYNPELIINIGVAGGISPEIKIGDVVIGKGVIQHDFDVSAFPNRKKGEISGIGKVEIPCTEKIISKFKSACKTLKHIKTHYGTILTGDQFINSGKALLNIKSRFGGLACEMEAGSIGQVCFLNNVDFAIIKSISDTANSNSAVDFKAFIKQASEKSSKLLLEFIKLNQD